MKKIKEVKKKTEVKPVNQEVVEMLESRGFKDTEIRDARTAEFKGYQATYAVKVTSEGGDQTHLILLSVFEDAYRFAIMDDVGIIKMCSFKPETPARVLGKYCDRLAEVLKI